MVYLSRIYTKAGDKGETMLGDGVRVPKDHPRVEAYGTVDELNAVLGLLHGSGLPQEIADLVLTMQNDLFDLGADLCVPPTESEQPGQSLRIQAEQVTRLEAEIDKLNEALKPLHTFVLPGGTPAAAWSHLARTICRRAERVVVKLSKVDQINAQAVVYLNRLSDLLFVLARTLNARGTEDVLWVPGKNRK